MSRGQLKLRDRLLYDCLGQQGLLGEIARKYRDFSDPLGYYRAHYAGLPAAALKQCDPHFYERLQGDGLLDAL